MRDRLLEEIGQTFRLERTQKAPGQARPHITPAGGATGPSGVGLDAAEQLLRGVGALVLDIREHVHATMPRPEDKDFSILKQRINGDKKSDPPTGRVTLDAAGSAAPSVELHVQMTEGFLGYVSRVRVTPTNPTFDLAGIDATITLRGVALKVANVRFARPHVLELNDEAVLKLVNTTAAPVTVEYAIEGWLRREA
jgi:hypothetical protein